MDPPPGHLGLVGETLCIKHLEIFGRQAYERPLCIKRLGDPRGPKALETPCTKCLGDAHGPNVFGDPMDQKPWRPPSIKHIRDPVHQAFWNPLCIKHFLRCWRIQQYQSKRYHIRKGSNLPKAEHDSKLKMAPGPLGWKLMDN